MCFYLRYRLLLPGHVPYIFFLLSILLSQTQIPPKHKLVLFDNFDFLFSVCRYWRQRQKPALNFPFRFKTKKKPNSLFFFLFPFLALRKQKASCANIGPNRFYCETNFSTGILIKVLSGLGKGFCAFTV